MVKLVSLALTTLCVLGVTCASVLQPRTSFEWLNCGSSSDTLTIDDIDVSPDPPQRDRDITLTFTGTAQDVIEEGAYLDITVKLGAIKLLQKSYDLCDELRNDGSSVQCPIDKGPFVITKVHKIPTKLPPANFRIEAFGYTIDEDDMFCVDLQFDFR